MATVSEVLHKFLLMQQAKHNSPDLLKRMKPGMEVQINVSAGDGEPVEGRRNTWTNGDYEWWNIRIPHKANTEPEWNDYEQKWPFELHAEAIGSTGWNWKYRVSRWVGFDFDALVGHAAGVGISDVELQAVKQKAMELDYVEVRRSTGGNGFHLYVMLDDIPTVNHTEHAALGRAILQMMSEEADFDFSANVDACGGNMWIWHRKANKENGGLSLVKPASRVLKQDDLPSYWKANVDVVTRRRSKIKLSGIPDDETELFEALSSGRAFVRLGENHKAFMEALRESGYSTVWVGEYHLLQTHTRAIKKIFDDEFLKKRFNFTGVFETNSSGSDPGTPNCFMFPLPDGAWKVFRFGPGCVEHPSWKQNGKDWTTCDFNKPSDLHTAAIAFGGVEDSDGSGYHFDDAKKANSVLNALASPEMIPEKYFGRECYLKRNKDGRLVVRVKQAGETEKPEPGWLKKRGAWLQRVMNVETEDDAPEVDPDDVDKLVRCLLTPGGDEAGWVLKSLNGRWNRHSKDNLRSALVHLGHTKAKADEILGGAILRSWTLVNLPFKDEYPGKRQWNLDAAQFVYTPADAPPWDRILERCGRTPEPRTLFVVSSRQEYRRLWTEQALLQNAMGCEPFVRQKTQVLHRPIFYSPHF